ncbi:LytR family transcriptional regulator [Lactococcus petauri]|uniref:LytR family transcriptional regulator n=1 Tax=Lactococcus petauri TaxID=1940789 RepID=UPI0022E557EF|nr:LytR family transcriptional regulator [Lactococcus petauri]
MEKETYRRSGGKKATKKKSKFPKVIGITLLVLILVFTGLGVFFYQSSKTAINKANTLHLAEARPVNLKKGETFTTLILGTARVDNEKVLMTSSLTSTNAKLKKTSLINVQPLLVFPDQTTLYQSYTQGGAETNKVVEINFDNMGKLVEASGGIVVQNTKAFVSKGFKFEQGSVELKKADEVSAYLSLLNSNDQKGYTDRLQDVAIATFENLKKPSVLARHSLAILKSFPEVVNTNISFPDFMNMVKHYNKALKVSKINVHATKIPGNKTQLVTQETLDKVKNKFENTLK